MSRSSGNSDNVQLVMRQMLSDAKKLVQRIHHHENAAESLISDAANLEAKLIASGEYREDVTKLNEIAKHRPRSTLILGSHLENQRIQDLESENRELHLSLTEHQSALELIMNKYREQVLNLLAQKGLNKTAVENMNKSSGDIGVLTEKVAEMAAVMQRAAKADEEVESLDAETVAKLKFENKALRELLSISGHPKKEIEKLKVKAYLEMQKKSDTFDQSDATSGEFDSSADEMENKTGTVKRKGKIGRINGSAEEGIGADNEKAFSPVTKIADQLSGNDKVDNAANVDGSVVANSGGVAAEKVVTSSNKHISSSSSSGSLAKKSEELKSHSNQRESEASLSPNNAKSSKEALVSNVSKSPNNTDRVIRLDDSNKSDQMVVDGHPTADDECMQAFDDILNDALSGEDLIDQDNNYADDVVVDEAIVEPKAISSVQSESREYLEDNREQCDTKQSKEGIGSKLTEEHIVAKPTEDNNGSITGKDREAYTSSDRASLDSTDTVISSNEDDLPESKLPSNVKQRGSTEAMIHKSFESDSVFAAVDQEKKNEGQLHASEVSTQSKSPDSKSADMNSADSKSPEIIEEVYPKKGSHFEGKKGGAKFRKSNKQKKSLQADLKKFFANDEGSGEAEVGKEEAGEAMKESPNYNSNIGGLLGHFDPATREIQNEETNLLVAVDQERNVDKAVDENKHDKQSKQTTSLPSQPAKEKSSLSADTVNNNPCSNSIKNNPLKPLSNEVSAVKNGETADHKDADDSIDSGISPSPTVDQKQTTVRTIELNFSDSDSDDNEAMIEDEFADIIAENESSSSGSDYSDEQEPEFEELELTEEEMVGDLGEGGEFLVSHWIRPAEEMEHLGESWADPDKQGGDKENTEKGEESGSVRAQDNVDKGHIQGQDGPTLGNADKTPIDGTSDLKIEPGSTAAQPKGVGDDEKQYEEHYSFLEASYQIDQFTGGSIKPKYAKRKSYQNANKASAVKLSAEKLSPGDEISHESLNQGATTSANHSDSATTTANNASTSANNSKTSAVNATTSAGARDSKAVDSNDSIGSSRESRSSSSTSPSDSATSGSDSSSTSGSASESSSGEIDPMLFSRRLSVVPPQQENLPQGAEHLLTDLLSDLDATLALSDESEDFSGE